MAEKDVRRCSRDDLERMAEKGDYTPTRTDDPEIELNENFWRNPYVVMPDAKGKTSMRRCVGASVHLRVDTDVLEWFKHQGKGHLTRMNAVLRAYMEIRRHDPRR